MPPAQILAVIGDDLIRVGLEAGIHLPAIATRSAPARFLRLDQDHIRARLGQMQRAGEAGEALPMTQTVARASPSRGGVGAAGMAVSVA